MAFVFPDDPATTYALDVRDGKEIASRLVRLACLRHLDDLEHAAERGLEWRADEARAVCEFFAEILRLPDGAQDLDDAAETPSEGQPFMLARWEAFVAGVMGWYTAAGYRRFRVAYCEIAKGNGKTAFAAGLLIYLLVTSARAVQLYCAAVTQTQARLAFNDCVRMVLASPALRARVDVRANNLAVLETGSYIRPISSEHRGLDGKRVFAAIIDELQEHPTEIVTAKLRASTKGNQDALILEITNSGSDLESVCGKHHDYSVQVLTGAATNAAWFAFVCHLDSCDRCLAAGAFQPTDTCPDCDDWTTEGPHWRKANPGLGAALPWSYLREQVREGLDLPSQRNLVRRLNFCQWTQQATAWIPPEQWAACRAEISLSALRDRPCYVGIDLSSKLDLSAVALVFPRPLDAGDGRADRINCAVDVLPFFWMPANTMHRRAHEDKVPYVQWQREGYLTVTPGDLVDHDAIIDFITTEIAQRYHVRGIGVDMAGATTAVTRLQRHFGDNLVIEIPQGFRSLSEPSKRLEALVVSGRLRHDGNPVLAWCIGNVAIEENRWQEIRPIKITQHKRIDGAVAIIDALAVMSTTVGEDEESEASKDFAARGLFV